MARAGIARLFLNGRSQAVRLPREFRFQGDRVRVRRVGNGVLLEPILDPTAWFDELDRCSDAMATAEQRDQPLTSVRDVFD